MTLDAFSDEGLFTMPYLSCSLLLAHLVMANEVEERIFSDGDMTLRFFEFFFRIERKPFVPLSLRLS